MPRPRNIAPPSDLSDDDLRPVVGRDGPDLTSAFFAISTWGNSTRFRELLIQGSEFPLPGDLPAFLLVNQLAYRGSCRPTDLADAIGTGRSNVSRVVSRLEQAGLVRRVADPTDDRAVVVALTANGRTVGERIVAAAQGLNTPTGEHWTPHDQADLEHLLIKLAKALDAGPQHPLTATAGISLV
jgi:DNA-binding MarR family transcriptional regulator